LGNSAIYKNLYVYRLLSLQNIKNAALALGSLVDRIDIHIEVPRVDYENLSGDQMGEIGETICACAQAVEINR